MVAMVKTQMVLSLYMHEIMFTVIILNFRTNQSWQTGSADPDQTAPRGAVCSGSSLFALPFASLVKYPKVWRLCLNFRLLQQGFLVSKNLGTLRNSLFSSVIACKVP